ncbi:MAG: DUF4209 domain-containing protein [Phycisphaerales bacterium]
MRGGNHINTNLAIPFCEGITEGGFEAAVSRIVRKFIPNSEHLRKEMHKQAGEHPLMSMIQVTISDEFIRARAGGVQDDESGRLVMHMHQHLAFESVFLRLALERLVSRYNLTAEGLVDLLFRSELFPAKRKPLFVLAVTHYLAGDHTSCAPLLVPQIENLLRQLLRSIGGVTVSLDNETHIYREKDLGIILRDSLMEAFWKQATQLDIALYLRVILVDHRALNARNRICHGLCDADWFTSQITDRLIHILLLLSQPRITAKNQ